MNPGATGAVYQVMYKIADSIRTYLTGLLEKTGSESHLIKKLIVSWCRLNIMEYLIYSAF